jgi:hypothetical protein
MINGIDYQKFLTNFIKTDVGKSIGKDFDNIICQRGTQPLLDFKKRANLTFREIYGKKHYTVEGNTSISITTLYYLQFLLKKNPKKIYDIGCGWNIWKKYYPNIVGVDFEGTFADINDKFDDNFIQRYYEKIESAICVNMYLGLQEDRNNTQIPCIPITFENYLEQIIYFSQIIKPGGRAYVSLNKLGFLLYTSDKWFTDKGVSKYDSKKLSQILLQDLKDNFPYKILCFDCELDVLESMSFDGCVRLVFEKT